MIFFKFPPIVICWVSLLSTFSANHILSDLTAINFENVILKFDSDEYQKIKFESNAKQSDVVDGYDNLKCAQQFSELKRSLNESEMWAMEGG